MKGGGHDYDSMYNMFISQDALSVEEVEIAVENTNVIA